MATHCLGNAPNSAPTTPARPAPCFCCPAPASPRNDEGEATRCAVLTVKVSENGTDAVVDDLAFLLDFKMDGMLMSVSASL